MTRASSQKITHLSKVFVRVAVELQLANVADRHKLLGPDFGSIKDIKLKVVLLGFWNDLDTKIPLWVGLVLDGLPQILAVEIGILTGELQRLVPDEGVDT